MRERNGMLDPIRGKSATLFIVAGGLLVVFAAGTGLQTFADAASPAVHDAVGPAGFFVGVVGLFGLYPALADEAPIAARVAAAVAAIPAAGWFVVAVFGIGNGVGILPDASVALPGVTFVLVFLTTILAYILFGAISLRADVHSTTLGVLLLTPAAVFLALIVGMGVLPAIEWAEFALDSGHALAHLAIGVALRSEGDPAGRAETTADATP